MKKNSRRLAYQNILSNTLEESREFAGTTEIQANPFTKEFLSYAVGLVLLGRLEGGLGHEAGEAFPPALVIQEVKQLQFTK